MYETHNQTKMGTLGWAGMAAYVIAWDVLAEETLTHAAHRGLDGRVCRLATYGAVAYFGAHLLRVIPEHLDPLMIVAKQIGEQRGSNT